MLRRKRLHKHRDAIKGRKRSRLQATSPQEPTIGVEADSEIPLETDLDEKVSEPLGECTSTKEHIEKWNHQREAKRVRHEQENHCGVPGAGGLTTEVLTPVDANVAGQRLNDQSQNGKEVNSDKARPLLIFYDCETTGISVYSDHITDIGAKVVDSPIPLETPTFSSLVATSRKIPPRVTKLTGITAAMLHGEKPISEVFPLFLNWVTTTTTYVSNMTKTPHYPVLVAHNGFAFDFPVMFSEVEHHRGILHMTDFEANKIHFSDSLLLLRQMKRDKHSKLSDTNLKLKMEALHLHIVGTPIRDAHRALPDVLAMEAILTHTSLGDCLTNLPVQSAKTQIELWTKQKKQYQSASVLTKALSITRNQAKRLVKLGLDYFSLKKLCTECPSEEAFVDSLRQKGVKSEPMCKNIANILQRPSS